MEEVKSSEERDMQFTDDTAMAKVLAKHLTEEKDKVNGAKLVREFASAFTQEPWRGYGSSTAKLLEKVQDMSEGKDVLVPAKEVFDGKGSFGNGAAMRVHPVALANPDDEEKCVSAARDQAETTHTHSQGVDGAVLLAVAVQRALHGGANVDIMNALSKRASKMEAVWQSKMALIEECLTLDDDVKAKAKLGNEVSAANSVPAAIYSALRVREEKSQEFEGFSLFEQALMLAYSFGGDTDTIGSMAGAISGALHGAEAIPGYLLKRSEAAEEIEDLATKLHDIFKAKK